MMKSYGVYLYDLRGLFVQLTGSICTTYGVYLYKMASGLFKITPEKGRKGQNQIQNRGLRRQIQKPKYRRKCVDSLLDSL